jgi:hypothetical protein
MALTPTATSTLDSVDLELLPTAAPTRETIT